MFPQNLTIEEYEARFEEYGELAASKAARWLWLLDLLPAQEVFDFFLLPHEVFAAKTTEGEKW